MAFEFNTIGQYEKVYAFEDAVIDKDMLNGTVGETANGKFTPAANGTKAIMQIEKGDEMGLEEYKIPAGSHVRVIDFVAFAEQYPKNKTMEIYGHPLPAEFAVGDKLASNEEGKLVAGASAAPYFEVTKVVGNKAGVEATVVTE